MPWTMKLVGNHEKLCSAVFINRDECIFIKSLSHYAPIKDMSATRPARVCRLAASMCLRRSQTSCVVAPDVNGDDVDEDHINVIGTDTSVSTRATLVVPDT